LNRLKAYDIWFSGLKNGIHLFDYQINDEFLKVNPSDEIESVDVDIRVQFEKQTRMLILDFDIRGEITVLCDRCLDPLKCPVESVERLIVKFGDEEFEETDEIIVLPESENKINIAQFTYEYLHLILPLQRMHGDNKDGVSLCDPDMLRRLSPEMSQKADNSPFNILKDLERDI
jgi:uncharacterized metal-binding protein YceD (DUF177 family)